MLTRLLILSSSIVSSSFHGHPVSRYSGRCLLSQCINVEKLAALGDSPLLAGEAKAAERGRRVNNRPDARVRLFLLYGIGDSTTSMRKWGSKAPPWLEVRAIEVPGHGYRADEALPLYSERNLDTPLSKAQLEQLRSDWVRAIADDMQPLLGSHTSYAIYGFSLGALIAYELCRELERRGAPGLCPERQFPRVRRRAARG